MWIEIILELLVGHLVTILKLTIVFWEFLDRIIGQMNILVIWIVRIYAEFWAWCPQIPFFKEVHSPFIVDKDPNTDVKLSLVN
jgi:hypothetical protein